MKEELELSLEYNKTYIKNKKLHLIFDYNLSNITDKKPTKKEFLNLVKNKIPKTDRDFFKIILLQKKIEFVFDDVLWFSKSIKKIKDTENRYQKKLILKPLPFIILNNSNSYEVSRFVEGSFRNYLNKDKKTREIVSNCIAPNIPLINFKFNFDNGILITLKQEFRYNIIAVLKTKKTNNVSKKMDFDSSVYTLLKYNKKHK